MRFDLDIKGDRAAIKVIDQLGDRAVNLRPVLTDIGDIIEEGIARNFEAGGGEFGEPWPALATSTLERKARQGLSPEVLRAMGDLEASLTGGEGAVKRVAKFQVRVGTKRYVARFQQQRRAVIGISTQDRKRIFRLLRRHMTP